MVREPHAGWSVAVWEFEAKLTRQSGRVDEQHEEIGAPSEECVGWQRDLGWRREVDKTFGEQ